MARQSPDTFALTIAMPGNSGLHLGSGVRAIYLEPYSHRGSEELRYLHDRGLAAGADHPVLALIIRFSEGKREMAIVPAVPEVHYRNSRGHVMQR